MTCKICEQIEKKDILYEDDTVVVVIPEKPAVAGHVVVAPKQHAPIFEAIPDFVIAHMGVVANKLSIALFEGLKAGGTNVIIQNGVAAGQQVPHVEMHVIPRRQDDKLPLEWEPKQLAPEQVSELEQKIKEEAKNIGPFQLEAKKPLEIKEDIEKIEHGEETNYLIKQLERIP